jgi:hypothetical protein
VQTLDTPHKQRSEGILALRKNAWSVPTMFVTSLLLPKVGAPILRLHSRVLQAWHGSPLPMYGVAPAGSSKDAQGLLFSRFSLVSQATQERANRAASLK